MKILIRITKYGNKKEIASYYSGYDFDLLEQSIEEDNNSHWGWIVYDDVDELLQKSLNQSVILLHDLNLINDKGMESYNKVEALIKSKINHPTLYNKIVANITYEIPFMLSEYEPEIKY